MPDGTRALARLSQALKAEAQAENVRATERLASERAAAEKADRLAQIAPRLAELALGAVVAASSSSSSSSSRSATVGGADANTNTGSIMSNEVSFGSWVIGGCEDVDVRNVKDRLHESQAKIEADAVGVDETHDSSASVQSTPVFRRPLDLRVTHDWRVVRWRQLVSLGTATDGTSHVWASAEILWNGAFGKVGSVYGVLSGDVECHPALVLHKGAAQFCLVLTLSAIDVDCLKQSKNWISFCVCNATFDDGTTCAQCSDCEQWYHWRCVGINKRNCHRPFVCPRCTAANSNISTNDGLSDAATSSFSSHVIPIAVRRVRCALPCESLEIATQTFVKVITFLEDVSSSFGRMIAVPEIPLTRQDSIAMRRWQRRRRRKHNKEKSELDESKVFEFWVRDSWIWVQPYSCSPAGALFRGGGQHLESAVQDLVSALYCEASRSLNTELGVAFARTSEPEVRRAEAILRHLANLVASHVDLRDHHLTLVERLREEYARLFPRRKKVFSVEKLLENPSALLGAELRVVQSLRDFLQTSESMVGLAAATYSTDAVDVSLTRYRGLNCQIEPIVNSGDSEQEFFAISQFLGQRDIPKHLRVHQIFRIVRESERDDVVLPVEGLDFTVREGRSDSRFATLHNKKLLFHGTKPSSALGVVSRGLLKPAMLSTESGLARSDAGMLGSGIYFSDSVSTACKYARPVRTQTKAVGSPSELDGQQWVFIASVALGNLLDVADVDSSLEAAPPGYHSVHGIKSSSARETDFEDDEFVIFDARQQCLRYLVVFAPCESQATPTETKTAEGGRSFVGASVKLQARGKPDDDLARFLLEVPPPPLPAAPANVLYSGNSSSVDQGLIGPHGKLPMNCSCVRARVTEAGAEVVVFQQYSNTNEFAVECKYIMDVGDTAAVCGFEAWIGDQHVVAELKERGAAQKEYREAVSSGKTAFLLEEEAADVFSIRVGQVPALASVVVRIMYVTEVFVEAAQSRARLNEDTNADVHGANHLDDDALVFTLPGALNRDRRRPSSQLQTAVSTVFMGSADTELSISITVGIELQSGDIRAVICSDKSAQVKLSGAKSTLRLESSTIFQEEFVVRIYAPGLATPRLVLESNANMGTYACAVAFMPTLPLREQAAPLDAVILLDCSSSMSGQLIEDMKRHAILLLQALFDSGALVRVSVICFGTVFFELLGRRGLAPLTASVRDELCSKIGALEASLGSSDLGAALWSASCVHDISEIQVESAVRNIFLFSDGNVNDVAGNSRTIIKQVAALAGATASLPSARVRGMRFFTFGMGGDEHCNMHTIRALARAGRGAAVALPFAKQNSAKIREQVRRSISPALTNISVSWGAEDSGSIDSFRSARGSLTFQAPLIVPSVFNGDRSLVFSLLDHPVPEATLRFESDVFGHVECIQHTVRTKRDDVLTGISSHFEPYIIHRLAARARIRDWENGTLSTEGGPSNDAQRIALQDDILALSLRWKVACSLTSFVAVAEPQVPHTATIDLSVAVEADENSQAFVADVLPGVPWPETMQCDKQQSNASLFATVEPLDSIVVSALSFNPARSSSETLDISAFTRGDVLASDSFDLSAFAGSKLAAALSSGEQELERQVSLSTAWDTNQRQQMQRWIEDQALRASRHDAAKLLERQPVTNPAEESLYEPPESFFAGCIEGESLYGYALDDTPMSVGEEAGGFEEQNSDTNDNHVSRFGFESQDNDVDDLARFGQSQFAVFVHNVADAVTDETVRWTEPVAISRKSREFLQDVVSDSWASSSVSPDEVRNEDESSDEAMGFGLFGSYPVSPDELRDAASFPEREDEFEQWGDEESNDQWDDQWDGRGDVAVQVSAGRPRLNRQPVNAPVSRRTQPVNEDEIVKLYEETVFATPVQMFIAHDDSDSSSDEDSRTPRVKQRQSTVHRSTVPDRNKPSRSSRPRNNTRASHFGGWDLMRQHENDYGGGLRAGGIGRFSFERRFRRQRTDDIVAVGHQLEDHGPARLMHQSVRTPFGCAAVAVPAVLRKRGRLTYAFRGPVNDAAAADCWLNATIGAMATILYSQHESTRRTVLSLRKSHKKFYADRPLDQVPTFSSTICPLLDSVVCLLAEWRSSTVSLAPAQNAVRSAFDREGFVKGEPHSSVAALKKLLGLLLPSNGNVPTGCPWVLFEETSKHPVPLTSILKDALTTFVDITKHGTGTQFVIIASTLCHFRGLPPAMMLRNWSMAVPRCDSGVRVELHAVVAYQPLLFDKKKEREIAHFVTLATATSPSADSVYLFDDMLSLRPGNFQGLVLKRRDPRVAAAIARPCVVILRRQSVEEV